ncbi:MAG TPA: threonine/serine dehydratase [Candidatus Binatia bacterium]|nr:threonine/serine dehydratase [Candidatus Binatia bacterium]
MLVDLQEITSARNRIAQILQPTPVHRSSTYSELVGSEVFLKLETLQPTHSFKVRGASNAALALSKAKLARGLITASGGNHGLALAYIARRLGATATVYLPVGTPRVKIEAIRALDARVVLHGEAWDDANQRALEVARETGQTYVHPFDSPQMMAGAGTIVLELEEQQEPFDLIVVSIGGGGLIAGILSAVQQLRPATRVVGVETVGADSMYQSLQAGELVELPAITSIVESLGARRVGEVPFGLVQRYAEDVVTVSDTQATEAVASLLMEEKLLAEPATACCLAALALGKILVAPGERVAVILCGANVSSRKVCEWLEQEHD